MLKKISFKALLKYFAVFALLIVYMELAIRFLMQGNIEARNMTFVLFVPALGAIFSVLSGFGKEKLNRILLPIVVFIITFFYIAQIVYFKNFGSLFSISMVGMGGDAIGNFGWALKDTLIKSIGAILILLVPLAVIIVLEIFKVIKCENVSWPVRGIAVFVAAILWIAAVLSLPLFGKGRQSAYNAYHNALSDTDSTANKLGAMTTSLVEAASYYLGIRMDDTDTKLKNIDISSLAGDVEDKNKKIMAQTDERFDFKKVGEAATDEDIKALCDYFADKQPTYTNEYTGMFEGYNLIYICAEAFWEYAVNEKVTPTLYKMANDGIVLNNYYNSFKNTTTNGEYAFVTSIWPDVSRLADTGRDVGSFPQSASKYMPYGLGKVFENDGAKTYGYHNYYSEYYRRCLSWPNIGFTNCKFMGEGMEFSTEWPASDLEMMEQSIPDYINDDRFMAYYMTFSGHGPYTNANVMYNRNVAEVKARLADDRVLDDEAYGYLAGELELDRAMEYLLNALEEKGILDKTLIVIAGDHYPYNISEAGRDSLAGHPVDPSIERYHSKCIMYTTGLKEPIVSDTYCCNVDIYPTVLNLFGIKYDSRLLAGRDIFSSGVHRAMLYNKSFISDLVTYNNETGAATWTEKAADYSDEKKENYLENMIALNESEYAASIKMLNKNFYFYLWRNSALMTQEEIDAENDREARVNATAAELRALDEQKAAEEAARKAEEEANMQPLLDENGNQVLDEEGNPIMVPAEPEVNPEGNPEAPAETPAEQPVAPEGAAETIPDSNVAEAPAPEQAEP